MFFYTSVGLFPTTDVAQIMKETHDEKKLRYAWLECHDKSGVEIRKFYKPYIDFSNEIARITSSDVKFARQRIAKRINNRSRMYSTGRKDL